MRFGSLDGLRCLAIVAVLFHHSPISRLWAEDTRLATRGFLGVDFFFVISGFLITTLLLRERDRNGYINLRGFYWRRVLRIIPLYYLLVTVVGGYYVFVKHSAEAAQLWPYYYLFLANAFTGDIPMLSPTWSLSVEEQYYFFWPVLMVLLRPRQLLVFIVLAVTLSVGMIVTGHGDLGIYVGRVFLTFKTLPFPAILIGSGLAILLHHRSSFELMERALGAKLAAPLMFAMLFFALEILPYNMTGLPSLATHIIMALCLGTIVIREDNLLAPVLQFTPIARIGVVSYGIYLLHHIARYFAEILVTPLGGTSANMAIYIALFWGGAWLLAELSFRFYERLFLGLRHKTFGRVEPSPRKEGNQKL
ncbi:acyltransferase family protein [Thioclava kandeliae]|uniref:Acyltransferase n=1 Tax=Thioclava kandeliae TaxID=3070818 RepID=A0ABV1SMQ4_9RHOB